MRTIGKSASIAYGLARATIRNIRQNLFFSFLFNGLGIPVAAGVLYVWISRAPLIVASIAATLLVL